MDLCQIIALRSSSVINRKSCSLPLNYFVFIISILIIESTLLQVENDLYFMK